MTVKVHGWAFSPYVRAVRIALLEKDVAHELRPLTPSDLAGPEGRQLSPFGRVPILEHGQRRLFETAAILDYVDAVFEGPSLLSGDPWRDAQSRAVIAAAGHYIYPTAVMGIFFNQAYVLANGGRVNTARLKAAVQAARAPLTAMEQAVRRLVETSGGPFMGGQAFGLADASLVPMIQNLSMADEGQQLLGDHPRLADWFDVAQARSSVRATRAQIPDFGLPPDE